MTVSSETKSVAYTGDAVTTSFAISFKFFELTVTLTTGGVPVTWTEGTQFTLVRNADHTGTLNTTIGNTPAAGTTLTITRATSRLQGTDYIEGDAFPANTTEDALDRLTMIVQEIYTLALAGGGGGGSVSDGDKGDIVVSGSGTVWSFDTGVVTAFAKTFLDDANAAAVRTTLGLGTLATQSGTFSGTSSGTNTGDETAAGILAKLITVDGAGSGLDADLLDGLSSAAFQPIDADLTTIAAIAGVRGDVLYYGASGWARLGVGSSGNFLKTNGAGADPSWAAISGGGDALVGNPLSQFAATTSAQLASVISDESGTGALLFATAIDNTKIATITFVIDGGGATITTGVKGYLEIPFACTINRATLLADQSGSIVVDIWKDTYANYPPVVGDSITASAKPTISSAVKSQDSTLTGWTTSITAGDVLGFNVDSITTCQRVTVSLKVTKT